MTALYIEPDVINLLIKKCSTFLLAYLREIKRIGVNGILMAEPAAGLLSPEMYNEFSSCYIKQIVDEVQDENFLFIFHNCGNTGQVTQSMISTGAGGLYFDNKIDIVETFKKVPTRTLVMSNLDPVGVFKMDKPEEIYNETTALLYKTAGYKNFVISSGCDTPPEVPNENIEAFFEAVNTFNLIAKRELEFLMT